MHNPLRSEAEMFRLVVVIGCKLGEIATKRFTVPRRGKRVIHLDIVAEEFGRGLHAVITEVLASGDVSHLLVARVSGETPQGVVSDADLIALCADG